jgi:flagellar protein FliO/FliZ
MIIDIARVIFALAAVLGLIGLAAVSAQRIGLGRSALGRTRRLAIVETLSLDAQRRAAIIRCDSQEHLIVLGRDRVSVIARDIPPSPEPAVAPAPFAPRKLHAPAGVLRFLARAPKDQIPALRAAGIL